MGISIKKEDELESFSILDFRVDSDFQEGNRQNSWPTVMIDRQETETL